MGYDRFIRWKDPPPECGRPTMERLARVAQDFLGKRWRVTHDGPWMACECDDLGTFALRSERDDLLDPKHPEKGTAGEAHWRAAQEATRGFEVFFLVKDGEIAQTSVITRRADEFTSALASMYASIIARWWNGEVEEG